MARARIRVMTLSVLKTDFLLRLSLAIPMLYHGWWNLAEEGQRWWVQSGPLFPDLRYVVGGIELMIAVCLLCNWRVRLASAVLAIVMLGATVEHLALGYSFKNNGFETPLAYFMIALFLTINKSATFSRT